MGEKTIPPKYFIQVMAYIAIAGMTIGSVTRVAGFLKDEIIKESTFKRPKP